jgi:acyl-homoserine-lactone acylase
MLEQWWEMTRATNLEEFESALKRLQVPMFNVIYADRDGHIFYLFNGQVPRRWGGSFMSWYGLVPGHQSRSLWTDIHPYGDLPRVVDPETGWLQNANDPPWTITFPETFDRKDFPVYLAPRFMHFRAQQSANMLIQDESISFEELIGYKHSTRMLLADRLLDDLLPAARKHGDEVARAAADILESWDRCADAESKGAVLFERWAQKLNLETIFFDPSGDEVRRIFREVWDPKSPHTTPDGLADPVQASKLLSEAATNVEEQYGSASVAWGDVYRLKYGDKDLPANGGPGDPTGIFRTAYFAPGENGTFDILAGDTFYALVEFSRPINARVLTSYGNASQPGSAHKGDQLELFARKEMRTPWLTRMDIESNLEFRDSFK